MLDWSKGLEGEALARVDAALTNAALPTLTQMRARYAHAGPLFAIPVQLSPEERTAIIQLISELALRHTNVLDLEWNPEDPCLLDVYTGYTEGRSGGGDVVTLRRAGGAWEVVDITVWAE